MKIKVYFDGLCEPKNPRGVATYGAVIRQDSRILRKEYGIAAKPWSSESTNNVAEYRGLITALKWLKNHGFIEHVQVNGDSRLVISQMKGEYKVKAKRLKELHKEAKDLTLHFKRLEFRWIPRGFNREADSLSRKAYNEYMQSMNSDS